MRTSPRTAVAAAPNSEEVSHGSEEEGSANHAAQGEDTGPQAEKESRAQSGEEGWRTTRDEEGRSQVGGRPQDTAQGRRQIDREEGETRDGAPHPGGASRSEEGTGASGCQAGSSDDS
jgi:hypothetical protein